MATQYFILGKESLDLIATKKYSDNVNATVQATLEYGDRGMIIKIDSYDHISNNDKSAIEAKLAQNGFIKAELVA